MKDGRLNTCTKDSGRVIGEVIIACQVEVARNNRLSRNGGPVILEVINALLVEDDKRTRLVTSTTLILK
jgi:hypothetical protein